MMLFDCTVRECFISRNVSHSSPFLGCFLDHLRERVAFQSGCSDSDFCVGFGSVFYLFVDKFLVFSSYTASVVAEVSMDASDI